MQLISLYKLKYSYILYKINSKGYLYYIIYMLSYISIGSRRQLCWQERPGDGPRQPRAAEPCCGLPTPNQRRLPGDHSPRQPLALNINRVV